MKILHAKLLDWTVERNFLHFSMTDLASPCSAAITIFFDFCFILCVRAVCSTRGLSSTRAMDSRTDTSFSLSLLGITQLATTWRM